MKRSDTDDFWIKIESLQWVLFVIFAIKNGKMVVIQLCVNQIYTYFHSQDLVAMRRITMTEERKISVDQI
jgi:hypothetical protein